MSAYTTIMTDPTKLEDYHHYKSAEFAYILCFSMCLFESFLSEKTWPQMRSTDPPNTPFKSSNRFRTPKAWGPDEDYYLAMQEGWWY